MKIFDPTKEANSEYIPMVVFDNNYTSYPSFPTRKEAVEFKKNVEKEMENDRSK